MTKRRLINFFRNSKLKYDNKAWWRGDVGYLIFDRCLLTLFGHNDKPTLLLIQRLRDIPFLAYDERRGVIVGSRRMTKEARA